MLCESHEMHASLDLRYHHSVGHFVIWYALFHSTASRVYLPCTTHSHVFLFCTSFHSKWRCWKGYLLPRPSKPLLYHSTLFHFIYVFVTKKVFAGCLCVQQIIPLVWRKIYQSGTRSELFANCKAPAVFAMWLIWWHSNSTLIINPDTYHTQLDCQISTAQN